MSDTLNAADAALERAIYRARRRRDAQEDRLNATIRERRRKIDMQYETRCAIARAEHRKAEQEALNSE